MPATELKAKLRTDLVAAMRAINVGEAKLLRTLIAAIDQAEAVAVGALHDKYVPRKFGDAGNEVPRRALSGEELRQILIRERDERMNVADQLSVAGENARAAVLRDEAELINRYLG